MKTQAFILTAGLLLICFSSFSQVKTEQKEDPSPSASTVTKGYYAIGNNAEKLNNQSSPGVRITTTRETFPTIQKGYYSLGNNNEKLRKQLSLRIVSKDSLPPAKKGYYSIGTNNEKPEE